MNTRLLLCILGMAALWTGCDRPRSSSQKHDGSLDWARTARVAGVELDFEMTDGEVRAVLEERLRENVSVIEIDAGLSFYLGERDFENVARFVDRVAKEAHDLGLRAVVYYPSLEVLTTSVSLRPGSMAKDHPDWLQHGLDGKPNVFVGMSEHWVEPDTESAWMSPNSGYRQYFLARVERLARTALDGVWVDVPVYLETGAAWAGAEPAGREAFRSWSKAHGFGGTEGLEVPKEVRPEDPGFQLWLRFRHENLADFLEEVRRVGAETKPGWLTVIENFPVDNVDASVTGLDATFRRTSDRFLRVYEVDSVSNTMAMQWANFEDFDNKIAMFKWSRASERENPSWVFSYGNQPLDAGLVMAAAVATGNVPFEAKTPDMLRTVDSTFRQTWYGFIQKHARELLLTPRLARVGVWYSSASRDYQDLPLGGAYGMYVTTTPPTPDPDWWATEEDDSAVHKPHLGGWRGAAHALIQMGIPFKPVLDPGDPEKELGELSVLWMDSVAALSDESAGVIRRFVQRGGVLLATGTAPGMLDEFGRSRPASVLADLFGFTGVPAPRAQTFGSGLAVYRPTAKGSALFAQAGDPDIAADALTEVERLLRIHAPDDVRWDGRAGVFVEVARPSPERHHLYVVNYSGLKQPLVRAPIELPLYYRAPDGHQVVQANVVTPDPEGVQGSLPVFQEAAGLFKIVVRVDQFALVTLSLAPAASPTPTPYAGPAFVSTEWKATAESGLGYVMRGLRGRDLPVPWSYGIFTNATDTTAATEIYAHGHKVTAEHMGLALRAAACMKDQAAYEEARRFVREVAVSPLYHVVNWALDPKVRSALLQPSDDGLGWLHGNAPLDDLRVVRGLLAGPAQLGVAQAEADGRRILNGLYWTSVTERDRDAIVDFPKYGGGLMGYAWDWAETDAPAMTPPATATGTGDLMIEPIPIDYQDLETLGHAARFEPRWRAVFETGVALLLDAEISQGGAPTGLFWNGLEPTGTFTGDFEQRDAAAGRHLKVIQVLWTALHLAHAAAADDLLSAERRAVVRAAAERSLAFFHRFQESHGRIPEYLTVTGQDVPACDGNLLPADCLTPGQDNLVDGEARIYALVARLAHALGDETFARRLVDQYIIPDRISSPADPRFGLIGVSTAAENDAEAWNVLESVLTICLVSGGR